MCPRAEEPRHERDECTDTEGEERRARSSPRRPERGGIDAELVPSVGLERGLRILHQLSRDLASGVRSNATRHVDVGELDGLRVRMPGELAAFDGQLALEQLTLCLHGHVLTCRHRERPRDQAGNPCSPHDRRRRARTGDAEDERDVRHETVADAEDGGPGNSAADAAMVMLDREREI